MFLLCFNYFSNEITAINRKYQCFIDMNMAHGEINLSWWFDSGNDRVYAKQFWRLIDYNMLFVV